MTINYYCQFHHQRVTILQRVNYRGTFLRTYTVYDMNIEHAGSKPGTDRLILFPLCHLIKIFAEIILKSLKQNFSFLCKNFFPIFP